ncbi:KdsC family phosphatase [Filimonas effusa]|uniref:3-deoxy-D-manno-octulosonate 8-phosphate phosphatase n=1 Tax=Filimonas effusa TaxID=2508721 RepID=A0A4Q1DAN9_9BACT|nr:HAD family hydrolase [Filimonas effusa]RXK86471.1 3-deoxy-D-manno-octulosonate 8-phosphate phosphatase [Filimonas effusa]
MNVLELFKPVTSFVFDIDGVLTDGMLLVMPGGAMVRRMNIKDGYALQLAIKKGYRVAVISGGDSPEVKERLHKLGVTEVFMKVENKLECLLQYMAAHGLQPQEVLFMGDDIPDYEAMLSVGLPCCPADAVTEIRGIARYISPFKGGEGCGRDVIEKTMKLRGDWMVDTRVKSQ